jgi:beta-glucosidase
MTVEEKVTQLVNQSRAIPKLSLPTSHLAYWDTKTDRWVVEKGRIEIAAGGSSSDVRLRKTIPVR